MPTTRPEPVDTERIRAYHKASTQGTWRWGEALPHVADRLDGDTYLLVADFNGQSQMQIADRGLKNLFRTEDAYFITEAHRDILRLVEEVEWLRHRCMPCRGSGRKRTGIMPQSGYTKCLDCGGTGDMRNRDPQDFE